MYIYIYILDYKKKSFVIWGLSLGGWIAQILRSLEHLPSFSPGFSYPIVRCRDVFDLDDQACIVMDALGMSLSDFLSFKVRTGKSTATSTSSIAATTAAAAVPGGMALDTVRKIAFQLMMGLYRCHQVCRID